MNRKIIYILAATLLAIVSCAKIEQNEIKQKTAIRFSAAIEKPKNETKAAISGTEYPKAVPFKCIAFYNAAYKEGTSTTGTITNNNGNIFLPPYQLRDDINKINAAKEWMPTSEIQYVKDQDQWLAYDSKGNQRDYYWPESGSILTFMAYSPASNATKNVTMNKDGIKTSWDSEAKDMKGVDFMMADIKRMTRNSAGTSTGTPDYLSVPLVFNHMMTKVRVSVARTTDDKKDGDNTTDKVNIKIRKIYIQNVYTKGTFSAIQTGEEWSNLINAVKWTIDEGSNTDIVLYDIDSNNDGNIDEHEGIKLTATEFKAAGEAYIAIPQALYTPVSTKPDYDYDKGQVITVIYDDLNDSKTGNDRWITECFGLRDLNKAWERNKDFHYTLTFGPLTPILFEGHADPWSSSVGGG